MKKNEIILIEGYPFIFTTGTLFILSILFRAGILWQIVFFILFLCMLNFFANPERVLDEKGDDVIISPADGEVISIEETKEPFFTNSDMIKLSIRLGLLDNHVQRAPIEGELKKHKYLHGQFLALSSEKASELNEQNRTLFENEKMKVITNQIAGFITRRIVTFLKDGEKVELGQRYGLIMFGSQVDVYIPKETKIKVIVGDKVKAGETLLALLSK